MTTTSTLTETNRALVREMYDAALRGDFPGLMTYLAPDVTVHEPAYLPYGGSYRGLEEFGQLMAKIAEHLDLGTVAIDYLVADGDRVVAAIRIADRKTGQQVLLFEQSTIRDGRVVEMKIFFHDAQSLIG